MEYFALVSKDKLVKLYIEAAEEFTVSEEEEDDFLVQLDKPLTEELKNRVGYFYLDEIKD